MQKNRVRYLAFGLWPSVSFCSASAKNFNFGASLESCSMKIFCKFPAVNISKLHF